MRVLGERYAIKRDFQGVEQGVEQGADSGYETLATNQDHQESRSLYTTLVPQSLTLVPWYRDNL